MASLLCYTGRTARWFTTLRTSDIMCMACAPIRDQIPTNLVAGPVGAQLKEGAATRSDSRGLRGGTSFERYVWISSNLLGRLNGALAMTGPWTSCFRETTKDYPLSKC